MIGELLNISKRLVGNMIFPYHRYLFQDFNLKSRITGLIGPRGTGKTTLLLQYIRDKIKDKDSCIYVSMDSIFFSAHLLFSFIKELYDIYGIRYFFLDEIHKYPDWDRELKNVYDSFPDIFIVFSGSSSIDLIHGIYDLSRRAVLFRLSGMSFREYLLFNDVVDIHPMTLKELLKNRSSVEQELSKIKRLTGHFRDYLGCGYYPFFFEDTENYHKKIFNVIEKTIFEDIANFYQLKTENLVYFKRILSYLATIPPGELSRNSISKNLGLDNKTVSHYLNIMSETGLIELICEKKSGSSLLRQSEKLYLENPDLYISISKAIGLEYKLGTIREIYFIRMLKNAGYKVFYSKLGDFLIDDITFEIGGKNKKKAQLENAPGKTLLVKDDILFGSKNEIPLFFFGFLY